MCALDNTKAKRAKSRLLRFIKERFLVRFHMTLIILVCVAVGLISTKIMLMGHIDSMLARYPLAVVSAYIAFFAGVRIWLWYAGQDNWYYVIDEDRVVRPTDKPGIAAEKSSPAVNATRKTSETSAEAFIDLPTPLDAINAVENIADVTDTVGTGAESSGDIIGGIGDALSGADNPFMLLVGIALVAILMVVLGSAVYLVYQAPTILSEAAFEFFLAAGLMKPIRKIDNPGWVGSVFWATVLPFAAAICISVLFALMANQYAPDATKLSEVIQHLTSTQ